MIARSCKELERNGWLSPDDTNHLSNIITEARLSANWLSKYAALNGEEMKR
jgi:hypothetical protein